MSNNNFTMVNFFDWLDEELEQRHWVRADLAKRAKISESGLSMAYSGKRGMGPNMLNAIAKALDLPRETVFRAAGLLQADPGVDPWVEAQKEVIAKLTGPRRSLAERLLQGLLDEERAQEYTTDPRPANATRNP